ncbi:unnamed protein product [Candidula unifasciata]|uniref:Prominin-1-A-like n=1 Tax=Candidula unifasciata TaxID=100452 RepID=A0A8S3YM04_9EUPU|nr:unnamed protein product [Candidula unifasciata]
MARIMTSVLWLTALVSLQEFSNTMTEAQNVSVLSPETVTDSYGNSADESSNIKFVDATVNHRYKSEDSAQDDFGSLKPLYGLSSSLVRTSLPGEFPYEWIAKVKENKIDLANDWKKAAVDYLGYTIALVVGIVFFVLFPIVGMCFCCCRCCGRCGGRRVIKVATEAGHGDTCGRLTALSFLSAFTTMALVGSILMFVTNSNLSTSLKDFCNNDIDKLDDVSGFLNSTVQQAEQLVQVNFNFTLAVLFRDLDNIGYLLGKPVHDHVLEYTGLADTYRQIEALETDAIIINQNLKTLNDSRVIVVDKAKEFHNFTVSMSQTLDDMAKKYPNFQAGVSNRTIVTQFDAPQLPDEQKNLTAVSTFVQLGISSLTAESKAKLNEIPEKVQTQTSQQRKDLKKDVQKYEDEITKIIDNLKNMQTDVMKGVDIDKMKANVKDITDYVLQYEQYRWYGGLAMAGILMLVALLLSLGILFGFFGGNPADDPTERSAMSNAGGNLLVTAVILTFIFAWLTMLVTTVLFAGGAPADKFACGAVRDLSIFDKLLSDYNLLGDSGKNESWLGSKIYAGKQVSLKLSELMESCKNSEAAYSALKMEEANILNLSEATDYKKKFSIEGKIDGKSIDFGSINITTGQMMAFIDFMGAFDMNYAAYNKTFQIDPVAPSTRVLESLISFNETQKPGPPLQGELEKVITEFQRNLSSDGKLLQTHIERMKDAVNRIKVATKEPPSKTLSNKCDTLKRSLKDVELNMSTNALIAFNKSVKTFENRLMSILDTFVSVLENAVKKKIGICRPLWNIYNDVAVQGICHSVVETLNTWWCTIGWTSFFLVMSICAAVKLSKHFRRMRYFVNKSGNNFNKKAPSKTHHFKNKICQADLPYEKY